MFSSYQYKIIKETTDFVKEFMKDYDESHNFAHVIRVKDQATLIAISENLSIDDIFEVQLGALTHDINDHKYNQDIFAQEEILKEFFKDKLTDEILKNVIKIACNVSLSKETSLKSNNIDINCKKLDCVRDADRLDSLGSIGITRYFIYGIKKNNSNVEEIIINLETRTNILMKHIKTNLGNKIAEKKHKIINDFIDDYRSSI
jgi:uncharacterized protein